MAELNHALNCRRGTTIVVVVFASMLLLMAASLLGRGFVWNHSNSLPRGLYRLMPSATARRGSIVVFSPPPTASPLIQARRYLPAGEKLLKTIVALPGDDVDVDAVTFSVNGRRIGAPTPRDSAGRALVPFRYSGHVPAGSAFVATSAPLSFDSRYFGPVLLSSMTVAVPVWTF